MDSEWLKAEVENLYKMVEDYVYFYDVPLFGILGQIEVIRDHIKEGSDASNRG